MIGADVFEEASHAAVERAVAQPTPELEAKPSPDPGLWPALTGRELQVATGLALGKTNRELADELDVSIKTIDTHRQHVMKKLSTRNNVELARSALRHGIVTL